MIVHFYKYQATGNDFIIIDDRNKQFDLQNNSLIHHMCNRRFGIGADGLILLRNEPGFDFSMIYFNADGYEGSMCGNGGRCAAAFAHELFPQTFQYRFMAFDGEHMAIIKQATDSGLLVNLSMKNVPLPTVSDHAFTLNTGSPHYVCFVDDAASVDVNAEGRKIRNSAPFLRDGINVNFVEVHPDSITVRTFERGVEEETLSCGTGVTASAIVSVFSGKLPASPVKVFTRGGELSVNFISSDAHFEDVFLTGPADKVFSGSIEV